MVGGSTLCTGYYTNICTKRSLQEPVSIKEMTKSTAVRIGFILQKYLFVYFYFCFLFSCEWEAHRFQRKKFLRCSCPFLYLERKREREREREKPPVKKSVYFVCAPSNFTLFLLHFVVWEGASKKKKLSVEQEGEEMLIVLCISTARTQMFLL